MKFEYSDSTNNADEIIHHSSYILHKKINDEQSAEFDEFFSAILINCTWKDVR